MNVYTLFYRCHQSLRVFHTHNIRLTYYSYIKIHATHLSVKLHELPDHFLLNTMDADQFL